MAKKIVEILVSKKNFYILLAYLLFGSYIFVSQQTVTDYYEIVRNILSNPLYLCIFFYPFLIINYFIVYQYTIESTEIITRMTRKELFIFHMKLVMLFSAFMIGILLLGLILLTNIFCNIDLNIKIIETNNFYKGYNIGLLLLVIIRVFISIITINAISLLLMIALRKQKSVGIIMMAIIIIIFLSKSLNIDVINSLLPSNHIYMFINKFSWQKNMLLSLIYYTVINLILFRKIKSSIVTKDLIGDKYD